MTASFDAFRIKITTQYVDLTRREFAEVKRDQLELTQMMAHFSDVINKVDWKLVNQTEDILT